MNVQATGAVFIPQKRTCSTSKLEFSSLLWVFLAIVDPDSVLPIRIRIRIPNSDLDPTDQNNVRIHNTGLHKRRLIDGSIPKS
jgi:hypothetical protein